MILITAKSFYFFSFYHNPGLKLPVYIPPPPVATAPSVAIPPFTAPAPAPLSP